MSSILCKRCRKDWWSWYFWYCHNCVTQLLDSIREKEATPQPQVDITPDVELKPFELISLSKKVWSLFDLYEWTELRTKVRQAIGEEYENSYTRLSKVWYTTPKITNIGKKLEAIQTYSIMYFVTDGITLLQWKEKIKEILED